MVSNLIDVEEAMYHYALDHDDAVGIFFDFEAAFPSVSHDLLLAYFRSLGWPPWLLQIIRVLYTNNFCLIAFNGSVFLGFELCRGIRQGCPLSPLLFSVMTELLLRRLRLKVGCSLRRAWADDLAMILSGGLARLPLLQSIFADFQRISGLKIHAGKTVIVPLFRFNLLDVCGTIARGTPAWCGVQVADCAKYLGYYVGPGKGTRSWSGPLEKFAARARIWGSLGLGMNLSLRAYRVYISTVLSFVGQLEALPSSFDAYEKSACESLFPGPAHWLPVLASRALTYMGMPVELPDMRIITTAASSRVTRCEDLRHGGLRVFERARNLRRKWYSCPDGDRVFLSLPGLLILFYII